MAAEISKKFRIEPTLIEGVSGVYDIDVDGKRIFSRHAEGRFPDDSEILDAIAGLAG